jgi:hypothetical protein
MLALRATTRSARTSSSIAVGRSPAVDRGQELQSYVSQLRKELAPDGSGASIVTRGRGYELKLPEDAVDAARL